MRHDYELLSKSKQIEQLSEHYDVSERARKSQEKKTAQILNVCK